MVFMGNYATSATRTSALMKEVFGGEGGENETQSDIRRKKIVRNDGVKVERTLAKPPHSKHARALQSDTFVLALGLRELKSGHSYR